MTLKIFFGNRGSILRAACIAFALALTFAAGQASAQDRDLVVATAALTNVLDPHKTVGEPGTAYIANVFDPLIRLNPTPSDGRGRHIPATAKAWKVSKDGLTIDFVLNEKAKFHDGKPVTAEDVKFSIERAVAPATKNPYLSSWLENIQGMDVLSPNTVRLRLTFAWAGTLDALAARGQIVPKDYLSRVGDVEFARRPIGSGPFAVESYKTGEVIELRGFADYWAGAPEARRITWRAIPDVNSRIALLASGNADLITNVLPSLAGTLAKDEFQVQFLRGAFQRFIQFNSIKGGPLADQRVRLALNIAIDRKALFPAVFGRDVNWVNGPSSSFQIGGNAAPAYPYDPALAKQLLAEAGYKQGFETELIYAPGRYIGDEELLPSLVSYWKKIGVDVRLVPMEYSNWLKAVAQKAFKGMATFAKAPGMVADPFSSFERHVKCGSLYSAYCNKGLDDVILSVRGVLDERRLEEAFSKVQLIAHNDPSAIYLFDEPAIVAHKRSIKWVSEFGPDLGVSWNRIAISR